MNVRIHDDAHALSKPRPQYDVGRLAGHAGKGEEFIHFVRHLAAKLSMIALDAPTTDLALLR